MPRKAGHADVADKIRGAFKTAMTRVDLVDLLEKELKERPLDTIRALAAWKPPETHQIEHSGSVGVSADVDRAGPSAAEYVAELRAAMAEAAASPGVAGNGQDGSGVPPGGDSEPVRH